MPATTIKPALEGTVNGPRSTEPGLTPLRSLTGPMRLTDRIRLFVISHYIEPARSRGATTVTVNAGRIQQQMWLESQLPAVCEALDTRLFQDLAQVTLAGRDGSGHSDVITWEFRIRPGSPSTTV
jgi:5-methylcytosine-specific restriction protein B